MFVIHLIFLYLILNVQTCNVSNLKNSLIGKVNNTISEIQKISNDVDGSWESNDMCFDGWDSVNMYDNWNSDDFKFPYEHLFVREEFAISDIFFARASSPSCCRT